MSATSPPPVQACRPRQSIKSAALGPEPVAFPKNAPLWAGFGSARPTGQLAVSLNSANSGRFVACGGLQPSGAP